MALSPQHYRDRTQLARLDRAKDAVCEAAKQFKKAVDDALAELMQGNCQTQLDYLNAVLGTQAALEAAMADLMVAVTAGQGIVQAAYEEWYECENPPPGP